MLRRHQLPARPALSPDLPGAAACQILLLQRNHYRCFRAGQLAIATAPAGAVEGSSAAPDVASTSGSGTAHDAPSSQALLYASALGCAAEQAAWLLSNAPTLLNVAPSVAAARLNALAFTFGRSAPAALALALKAPRLLELKEAQLQDRIARLAASLQLPNGTAVALAYVAPEALLSDGKDAAADAQLRSSVGAAASVLDCSHVQAVTALRKQPRALLLGAEALSARLTALEALFGLAPAHVRQMARASPGLLTQSMDTIKSKFETLREALGMPVAEAAQVSVQCCSCCMTPPRID